MKCDDTQIRSSALTPFWGVHILWRNIRAMKTTGKCLFIKWKLSSSFTPFFISCFSLSYRTKKTSHNFANIELFTTKTWVSKVPRTLPVLLETNTRHRNGSVSLIKLLGLCRATLITEIHITVCRVARKRTWRKPCNTCQGWIMPQQCSIKTWVTVVSRLLAYIIGCAEKHKHPAVHLATEPAWC